MFVGGGSGWVGGLVGGWGEKVNGGGGVSGEEIGVNCLRLVFLPSFLLFVLDLIPVFGLCSFIFIFK